MSTSPIFPAALPRPIPPCPSSSASTPVPLPDLSTTLRDRRLRMKTLPDVLHPPSATILSASTLSHAERVRNAMKYAKQDSTSPRWAHVHKLTRLGCTRSRTYLVPYLPPIQPEPGTKYLLAETEEEWHAWEADRERARQSAGGGGARPLRRQVRPDLRADVSVMRLTEKVARWQERVLEDPSSQAPVGPLSPTITRPIVQSSQSRLSFTSEKKNTVASKSKMMKRVDKPAAKNGESARAGPSKPTQPPSRRASRKQTSPARVEPIAAESLQSRTENVGQQSFPKGRSTNHCTQQPPPVLLPPHLPTSTSGLDISRQPVTSKATAPISSQLSGLTSPPLTPSKHDRKGKGKQSVVGPTPTPQAQLQDIAEADSYDELYADVPSAPAAAERVPEARSDGSPARKRARPLTPTSEDPPGTTRKRTKRADNALRTVGSERVIKPWTSHGTIPGLARTQSSGVKKTTADTNNETNDAAVSATRGVNNTSTSTRSPQKMLVDYNDSPASSVPLIFEVDTQASNHPATNTSVPRVMAAIPSFSQNPDLFAPGETSIMGAWPPHDPGAKMAISKVTPHQSLQDAPSLSVLHDHLKKGAPGPFTQNPNLFAPEETSTLGGRPTTSPKDASGATSSLPTTSMAAVQPGQFTQQPALFAPRDTSIIGDHPASPSPKVPLATEGQFTQDPDLFAPGETSIAGARSGARSAPGPGPQQPSSQSPLITSPVLYTSGQHFGGESYGGQAQRKHTWDMTLSGGLPSMPDAGPKLSDESMEESPVWAPSGKGAGGISFASLDFNASRGSGSGAGIGRGFGGVDESGELYSSQYAPGMLEEDMGETSAMLERDVEYVKWMEDENGNASQKREDMMGSSQEVRNMTME